MLEQVKLFVAKLTSPAVCVYVVQPIDPENVVVPAVLIVNAAIVLPFVVMVPVPTIVAVNVVNVPPLERVKLLRFKLVAPGLNAVVPKLSALNQLPLLSVAIAVPEPVNVKFGALAEVPPAVEPNAKVLVISAAAVNPPVPV